LINAKIRLCPPKRLAKADDFKICSSNELLTGCHPATQVPSHHP
jgi:hypothetical protein